MKVELGLTGTEVAPADYARLKAALIAAQAATRTARAGQQAPAADPRDALEQMFAGEQASPSIAAALQHRFARAPLPIDQDQVTDPSIDRVDRS